MRWPGATERPLPWPFGGREPRPMTPKQPRAVFAANWMSHNTPIPSASSWPRRPHRKKIRSPKYPSPCLSLCLCLHNGTSMSHPSGQQSSRHPTCILNLVQERQASCILHDQRNVTDTKATASPRTVPHIFVVILVRKPRVEEGTNLAGKLACVHGYCKHSKHCQLSHAWYPCSCPSPSRRLQWFGCSTS